MDWPACLRAAAALGLGPHRFWRLSLVEWRALTGSRTVAPMSREAFDALAARFPDIEEPT